MEKMIHNLRKRYFLFIAVVVLTTVVTQAVIHRYLSQQVDDAGLINLASRQSTLGQRITKLALYIQADQQKGEVQKSRIDSLQTILTLWKNSHQQLLKRTNFITHANDSLLAIQTKLIESISHASESILNTTEPDKAQK